MNCHSAWVGKEGNTKATAYRWPSCFKPVLAFASTEARWVPIPSPRSRQRASGPPGGKLKPARNRDHPAPLLPAMEGGVRKRPPETVAFSFAAQGGRMQATFSTSGNGAGQMLPLLADRARSECARSMRAVGRTCTHSARIFTKIARLPPVSQQSTGLLQICQLWHTLGYRTLRAG
jgi:hypothetical protein